ncbi:3-deoxy-7-phosphoheptulonate synthase [Rubrivirga sp. S365]|uniref:3-deoxy-7-phosphoheptulonate synthase n=1 Tax=Rubrivirga litoralis TaxID=3075598 RepID=A0ABU3BSB2_9BACT|nr:MULTISPECIES: 3-deoxy-7-phosphoheptulonate synthase [unclassified Rubrivirga]MDT0632189.1 3-deoxy-7-phosphoheptulonate synthase [Rubrivirga sp. F394]MDT7856799.1 3-deoxy-7-phosphoheptulonate synthase [Rubrivirga sp. S365]
MAGLVVIPDPTASDDRVEALVDALHGFGFDVHRTGGAAVVLGAMGVDADFDVRHIKVLPGVRDVVRITSPYKFAARTWHPDDTVVDVDGLAVGGAELVVMAGPCSVEGVDQIEASAAAVAATGAQILRGGAFKPRSSPYSFQGMGEEGLRILREAGDAHGLKVVTEVMTERQIDVVGRYAHVFQIGARNMQNFALLKEVGQAGLPVLLKRGMSATIEEWLMSAEYVLAEGNPDVILCERGIRTFETATRNTLDLSAVPVVKQLSHLPIIVDPSHGVGIRDKIGPMALAGVACGADGLMIETHPNPPEALSDGPQSLYLDAFDALMGRVRAVGAAVGRDVPEPRPAPVAEAA